MNNDITTDGMFARIETVCQSLDSAWKQNDRVKIYRLTVVLLKLICDWHTELRKQCDQIEAMSKQLNTLPTEFHSDKHYHHTLRSGWGRSSRFSGYWVGSSGNQLRMIEPVDRQDRIERITVLHSMELRYNHSLNLLQGYANHFAAYRDKLLTLPVRNVQQRKLQNVLTMTYVSSHWLRERIEYNPVLGIICGKFYADANLSGLFKLLKGLTDKKGKIGRKSMSQGAELVRYSSTRVKSEDTQYLEWKRSKSARCSAVSNYVTNSERYKKRLGWLRGLKSVEQALQVIPFIDDWKQQFEATNRLAYSIATNRNPYVLSLVTSQPEQVETITHLETTIPVYRVKCLLWERENSLPQYAYFLGKTGSVVVDRVTSIIDWIHYNLEAADNRLHLASVLDSFQYRLGYARNQKLSLLERRKEIAIYARKLVWIETMSMLDSKQAGNCLPGTIQFAKEIGIDCPSNWTDYQIDARTLLRKWKQSGYNVNRLLLPAIDSAVNRVKATLAKLTVSGYVPNFVK